jgi:hypothetical protein
LGDFWKEKTGADSLPYAQQLVTLGRNLLLQLKGSEAEGILREGLAIREKKEPDAWTTFNAQSVLGGALLLQKRYVEAEPLLLKGYKGMTQRRGICLATWKVIRCQARRSKRGSPWLLHVASTFSSFLRGAFPDGLRPIL